MPCNPPSAQVAQVVPHLQHFASIASWAAQGLDVTCTSWFRTPAENFAVGGDEFSQHLVGWGMDVAGPGSLQFASRARLAGLPVVNEGDHIHIQLFPAGTLQRWAESRGFGSRRTGV